MDAFRQDISELQRMMTNGETTSKNLTMMYLQQIASYDQNGPNINAILEINPDALHTAEALDVERKRDGTRGPLHGIPIIVKDNIDTGDKMHTSAGSVALEHHYAKQDAFLVKQLRDAGVIILGKSNLTEWANFITEGMPNGYSSRGGQVLNPYGPGQFDVGGSSSGSAAAVASQFAAGAIGTETSGSILSPASSNSVVGLKPTVGLISRTGIIPIANSQDTAGPITKTVEDAAVLLGALVGIDDEDSATKMSRGRYVPDYTKYLQTTSLQGARIGVDRGYLESLDEEELTLIEQAIENMQKQGAEIVDITITTENRDSSVMFHEFKNGLNAYLSTCSEQVPVHTLHELIQYNEEHADVALRYGQTLFTAAEEKSGTLTEPEYLLDRLGDIQYSQKEGIDRVMKEHSLEAILFANNLGAGIAAMAGYPSISVPAGFTATDGKPVGLTLTSMAFQETQLLSLAYAYEQTSRVMRKSPSVTE
ncbi:amidase [Pontibacillus yanchengensis]|uniref:Amidase n=2 Tax=Pontibacillus yanchengensis TaxID=462910 RepID=A0ACC7VF09_9BACI|nr:amidase family protein [Pontibacillus yanchengensis]MYL32194.1 amidase [Pontibacillus yanchengensis]MYL52774.1 amidase [Pontibacillus yanchengensis]